MVAAAQRQTQTEFSQGEIVRRIQGELKPHNEVTVKLESNENEVVRQMLNQLIPLLDRQKRNTAALLQEETAKRAAELVANARATQTARSVATRS